MKNYPLPFIILFLLTFYQSADAQTNAPSGVFEDTVYHSVLLTSNIDYGSNFNFFDNTLEALDLDVYEPNAPVNYKRPLIIYFHGGGFTSGDKTTDKAGTFGNYFAKCGYVMASINYRLGKEDPYDTVDNFEEVYQATQDAKSAIRFFKENGEAYCVDTSAIFLIGTSAGASLCLTCAYWDQQEADAVFNTTPFGPLDGSSGNPGYSSSVRAIVSCWGGIPDTAWLHGETTPNQLFHGNLDPTVPYTSGEGEDGIYLYGSKSINDASIRDHIESYLHTFWGASHGVGQNSRQFDTLEMISTAFIYNHLPPGEGTIGCDSVRITVDSNRNSFQVFPNPGTGDFFITSANDFSGVATLYNTTGKEMNTSTVVLLANVESKFHYTGLSNGIYLLRLENDLGVSVLKIVIRN